MSKLSLSLFVPIDVCSMAKPLSDSLSLDDLDPKGRRSGDEGGALFDPRVAFLPRRFGVLPTIEMAYSQ